MVKTCWYNKKHALLSNESSGKEMNIKIYLRFPFVLHITKSSFFFLVLNSNMVIHLFKRITQIALCIKDIKIFRHPD